MKYVHSYKRHFLKENLCTLQVFLCALISRPARLRKRKHWCGTLVWSEHECGLPFGWKGCWSGLTMSMESLCVGRKYRIRISTNSLGALCQLHAPRPFTKQRGGETGLSLTSLPE